MNPINLFKRHSNHLHGEHLSPLRKQDIIDPIIEEEAKSPKNENENFLNPTNDDTDYSLRKTQFETPRNNLILPAEKEGNKSPKFYENQEEKDIKGSISNISQDSVQ